jgi:hypothetical protein
MNPMRRSLNLGMTAAVALLALGCEGLALPIANDVSNDFSSETFDTPANDQESPPGDEPGDAPAGGTEVPNSDPVEGDPLPGDLGHDIDPREPSVLGPRWPGACRVVTMPADPMSTTPLGAVEFAYDDAGRATDEWRDTNSDAQPDEHIVQQYDDTGRLVSIAWDNGFDGSVDALTLMTWEEGKRSRTLRDDDNDGIFDAITTTSLAADGRPERTEHDADGDGIAETRRSFSYDAEGRIAFEIVADLIGTGPADTITYIYDPDSGRLSTIDTDLASNGQLDAQVLYAWSPEGDAQSETIQNIIDFEGTQAAETEIKTTWQRDPHGNIEEAFIERFDGQPSVRVRHDYGCWQ